MRRWLQAGTLRRRLALWYAAVGTLLLAGFSATLYEYVAQTMARPLDQQLRADLKVIRGRLAVLASGTVLWDHRRVDPSERWGSSDPWFELWDGQSHLVARCWSIAPADVEQYPLAPPWGRETLSVFNVSPDLRLRSLSVPLGISGSERRWMIRVMRVHEPIAEALGALRWITVLALPIVIALLVVGGYAITVAWLKPLDAMAAAAGRISADDLGLRLPVANPHDELGRVATVFNVTLDRLESSFVALDRFVADASHQLRTPLTTLRSVGEVGLRRCRTVEEYGEIIGSMLEEAQRLQLLVQRLLELANAEGGKPVLRPLRIRLDEHVSACVAEISVLAELRSQRMEVTTVPGEVTTDPILVRQALQNLVDNAIKYSPEGATIRVCISENADSFTIAVTDDGPGIGDDLRSHLSERFYRPTAVRHNHPQGFGLGLALAGAYMRALGGSLEWRPVEPHGASFRLTLPK